MSLSALTDEQVKDLAASLASVIRPPEPNLWNRRLDIIIGAIAIISLIFSAGINWSRLGSLETRVEENAKRIEKTENAIVELGERIADNRGDVREIVVRLSAIAADLAEIKGRLNVR